MSHESTVPASSSPRSARRCASGMRSRIQRIFDAGVERVGDQAGALLDEGCDPASIQDCTTSTGLPRRPHHGVVDRPPGVLRPDDRGLALVGQPGHRQLVGADAGIPQGGPDDFQLQAEDLHRIVFDAARVRVELRQLGRAKPRMFGLVVDDECAGACGAFVDTKDVRSHARPASSSSADGGSRAPGPHGHAALARCGPGNARHAGRRWSSTCTHLHRPLWSAAAPLPSAGPALEQFLPGRRYKDVRARKVSHDVRRTDTPARCRRWILRGRDRRAARLHLHRFHGGRGARR